MSKRSAPCGHHVEAATGRNVIAFMSQVHFDPDVSLEAFVLQSDDGSAPAED